MDLSKATTKDLENLLRTLTQEVDKRRESEGIKGQPLDPSSQARRIGAFLTPAPCETMLVRRKADDVECKINLTDYNPDEFEAIEEEDVARAEVAQQTDAERAETIRLAALAQEEKAKAGLRKKLSSKSSKSKS